MWGAAAQVRIERADSILRERGRKSREAAAGAVEDITQPTGLISHYDHDFFHYDLESMHFACEGTGLTLANEGEWGHPNNSKMLVFTREVAGG